MGYGEDECMAAMFHLPVWIILQFYSSSRGGLWVAHFEKESEAIRTKSTGRASAAKGYIWAQQHAY